jgi:hypothetical protein
MTLDMFKEKGTPLDKQLFTWREMVQAPTSKLDDDAFTPVIRRSRVRVLTDPRSSLTQCLQAMLTAELTDNDGWQLLVDSAQV